MATGNQIPKNIYTKEFEYFAKKYAVDLLQNQSGYATVIEGQNVTFIAHTIRARVLDGVSSSNIYQKDGVKSTEIEAEITKATQFAESFIDAKTAQDTVDIDAKMTELEFVKEASLDKADNSEG